VRRVQKYSQIPERDVVQGIETEYVRSLQLPSLHFLACEGVAYYVQCRSVVRQLLNSLKLDLLHAHTALPDGMAAVLLGREFNLPVVCTLHGSDISLYPRLCRSAYTATRWVLRNIDQLIAVSNDLKKQAEQMSGRRGICVAHNGANPQAFKPMPKFDARAELRLDAGRKLILFVGNLIALKGVDFLLEAVAKLNRPDVSLYLIGDGPLEGALKDRAERLGIGRQCMFIGRQPHERIPVWLCAADCLVLPSLSEGFPTIVSESMVCRTVVVATDVGGTSELITDGDTGFLVAAANSIALMSAIDRALSLNPPQCTAILNRAERLAHEMLTWDVNAQRTLDAFHQALGHGTPTSRSRLPEQI